MIGRWAPIRGVLHSKPRIAGADHKGKAHWPLARAQLDLLLAGCNCGNHPERFRGSTPSLMARQDTPQSCILYQNDNGSVVCLDIPRSIEEAQSPREVPTDRRLLSTSPLAVPFETPEANYAPDQSAALTPSSQLSQLMTGAAVQDALQHIQEHFPGPYYLPRATQPLSTPAEPAEPSFTPEGSHALIGSIQQTREEFISTAPPFDLIVVDPPWPNRSAKRKRQGYSTCLSHEATRDLLSLIPVPAHLAPNGVVAVWVTNNHNAMEVLTAKEGLFAQWGLELAAEWIWLKVTASGRPMVDIESTWRKPWERLLIATRRGGEARRLADRRVIVAVPDLHSRKPNLRRLFDDLLPLGYRGLEVFARHLTAGWWSWGEEVTMFQAERHWTRYPGPESVDCGRPVDS